MLKGILTSLEMSGCDDALQMRVQVGVDRVVRLAQLGPRASGNGVAALDPTGLGLDGRSPVGLPLLDVVLAGTGRTMSGRRYSESVVGNRMLYVGHNEHDDATWHELSVALNDPSTGLSATVIYQVLRGGGVLRSLTKLANNGDLPLIVESVTSFLGSGLAGPEVVPQVVEVRRWSPI